MKDRDKARAHLRDDMLNPGPGMFDDPRAETSAAQAYARVVSMVEWKTLASEAEIWLRTNLLEAAKHYWADHDYDDRTFSVDLRPELKNLQQALEKVSKAVAELSRDGRARLRAEMDKKARAMSDDPINCLAQQIANVLSLCKPIALAQGKKGPRAETRVVQCCARLWDIRERLTGQPFAKTLTPKMNKTGNATTHFVGPDAQFVLDVMKAIDHDVTFAQVHNGLSRHGASASKRK